MAAMQIASGSEYDIISMPKKWKIVLCEEGILYLAEVQLHDLVKEVLCWRCILFRDTFCVKISVASSYYASSYYACWRTNLKPHNKTVNGLNGMVMAFQYRQRFHPMKQMLRQEIVYPIYYIIHGVCNRTGMFYPEFTCIWYGLG